jgi:hypothetical protein
VEADERANLSAHKVVDGRKNSGRMKREVIDPRGKGVPREFVTATRRTPFGSARAACAQNCEEIPRRGIVTRIPNRSIARRSVSWPLAEAKWLLLVDVAASAGDTAY